MTPGFCSIAVMPIAALFLLAACTTMSREDCRTVDWLAVGESDGAAGRPAAERLSAHTRSCERAGIVPDHTRWRAGYDKGLPRYCTPMNGFEVGNRGSVYHDVCPSNLADGFLRARQLGAAIRDQRRAVVELDAQIREMGEELRQLRHQDEASAQNAEGDGLDARVRLHELEQDRWQLQMKKGEAEHRLKRSERAARIIVATLQPAFGAISETVAN
ncbi:DUF2799 domain-containing protein [Pseudohoeflea coraliihabitans]|uniref:DUF2799 domain-containing protein n=1 Tax=Pseudohoeflea coraliihabitans TaxID=2860393 RepID=A0ABS6WRX8_9HYPH|nr:DUF2799 domain-containing protein [Pseudohoeflea sp. DP4N28-3]MBW3098721.1 DUF2799 domain-containing protein [Pseudohoeflea sp. DP4N28-3]